MSERIEARRTVRADRDAPGLIRALIEAFAQEQHVSADDLSRVLIAVEELVTNIIKYGYDPGAPAGSIAVTVWTEGNRMGLGIVDDSNPFNPFVQPEPDLAEPLEKRRIGGLGLHLVKAIMDRTHYERVDSHNVVEISRRVTRGA
ncbi:MAG TPA: ATP-binding protein [Stellaceae bacterium]|nr:ATP-binding protein [Stellaceae bacterium]